MKGLFIKDFLTLRRKYGPVRIAMDVLLIAVLMIAFGANGAIWVSFVLVPIEAMTMCMTLTNCDEQWKWQKYAFALPVSRAQIVRARYLLRKLVQHAVYHPQHELYKCIRAAFAVAGGNGIIIFVLKLLRLAFKRNIFKYGLPL